MLQHAIVQVQRAIGEAVETFRTVMQGADASASARVSAEKTALEAAIKAVEDERHGTKFSWVVQGRRLAS